MINLSYLTRFYKVDLIIEFGETSNSERNDIDLLIISDDFEDMFTHKRKKMVENCIISNYLIDPICVTSDEFCKMKNGDSNFTKQILKGDILYDRRSEGSITRTC